MVGITALLVACSTSVHMPRIEIQVAHKPIEVEVADDPTKRATGLMYRKTLETDSGMLFIYPTADIRSFWMENTSLPLSIAFIDSEGVIVNIEKLKPYDRTSVLSKGNALYALEMNRGWFAKHGIEPGGTVQGLPAAAPR
ncbi:MAG: DUF192 domain-containing protein [Myxococcota bacterium]|nr:DUF192 domain-containing protein [Myxococcota bacterium]